MSSGYRSWDEREADTAKTRAEASRIQAEAKAAEQAVVSGAAKTDTDLLAERVKQARLLKQLEAVKGDAAGEKARREQQRRDARGDAGTWFKLLVNVVLGLGLLAALPAQLSYFLTLHRKGERDMGPAWTMLPVPFFLEILAWVGVLGTQWAHRKGLPRWPFWILTASLASVAGYINLTHGTDQYGLVAGVALAATSIIGPALAEVRQFLESKAAADPRSLGQRAIDKAAEKQASAERRAAAKIHAAEDKRRRGLYPEEFAEFERIIVAHPTGAITREAAWRQAWDNRHLLPLATTVDTLASREDARAAIHDVLSAADRTPESVAVDRLIADIFRPDDGDGGSTERPPGGDPKGGSGGGSRARRREARKAATTLGGKGKRVVEAVSDPDAERPLEAADLDRVRSLADALGDATKLSARNVREAVGCRTKYAMRLRDAVKGERATP